MDRWGIELLSQADFHSGLTPLDCAVYVGKEALVRMLVAGLGSGDDSAASELLEQARRCGLEPSHDPLALFRGLPWAVKLALGRQARPGQCRGRVKCIQHTAVHVQLPAGEQGLL